MSMKTHFLPQIFAEFVESGQTRPGLLLCLIINPKLGLGRLYSFMAGRSPTLNWLSFLETILLNFRYTLYDQQQSVAKWKTKRRSVGGKHSRPNLGNHTSGSGCVAAVFAHTYSFLSTRPNYVHIGCFSCTCRPAP